MSEKEKIGAFVSYHNIIRPVDYPLYGLVFAAALLCLFFGRFSISQPENAIQSSIPYIGLGVSLVLLILSIVIRIKVLKVANIEPGKSLYLSQMILYIYCAIVGELFIFAIVGFKYGRTEALYSACISFLFSIIIIIIAYFCLIKCIRKGLYVGKKRQINEKLIAFAASAGGVAILLTSFQFIRIYFNIAGYAMLSTMLVGMSSVLAFSYYLKLRYAKKYDLENRLPKRPLPSRYTHFQ